MKPCRPLILAVLFCCLSFLWVWAGDKPSSAFPDVPRLFGAFTPKVGVWSEYEIAEKGSNAKITMRMSIVGQEGASFWYEVVNQDPEGRNIIKMLVKGNPNDSENIQRLIIQSGDQQPTEMPRDFVVMGRKMARHMFEARSGVPAEEAATVTVKDLGEKTLEVPAGSFTGMEKQIVDGEGKPLANYLFVADVLPFGIIYSESEQATMTLLAHGEDATSEVTAEPVKLKAPQGMPEGMPRGMPPGMEQKQQ